MEEKIARVREELLRRIAATQADGQRIVAGGDGHFMGPNLCIVGVAVHPYSGSLGLGCRSIAAKSLELTIPEMAAIEIGFEECGHDVRWASGLAEWAHMDPADYPLFVELGRQLAREVSPCTT